MEGVFSVPYRFGHRSLISSEDAAKLRFIILLCIAVKRVYDSNLIDFDKVSDCL